MVKFGFDPIATIHIAIYGSPMEPPIGDFSDVSTPRIVQ